MKKAIVTVALMLLFAGIILAVVVQEQRVEEETLDKWDPIHPSTLYPRNSTGWAFMAKTSEGTFLELNISASDFVRVRVGIITNYDETTKETYWKTPLLFDNVGTSFDQRISINGTNPSYFLEIKNESEETVTILGSIKKLGNVSKTYYPYSGLGTLMALVSFALLIYALTVKSKKRLRVKSR